MKPIEVDGIGGGEKFALLCLSGDFKQFDDAKELSNSLLMLPRSSFRVPGHWREWLGSMNVEEIEDSDLYVLHTMPSLAPTILDNENSSLTRFLVHFYTGLQTSRKLALYNEPFIVGGGQELGTEVEMREYQKLDAPGRGIVHDFSAIDFDTITDAAKTAYRLHEILSDSNLNTWRLSRCLMVYLDACNSNDILERVHQFTRCVEGLIMSSPGKGAAQFKSRTELFVGPSHHDLMGSIYELRGEIEHLHEHRRLETFDRATRIEIAKLEAVIEWVARDCIRKIIENPELTKWFANAESLTSFWAQPPEARARMWGLPIDPYSAIGTFDLSSLTDEELGKQPLT